MALRKPLPDTASLDDALSQYVVSLRAAGRSEATVAAYSYAIGRLISSVGPDAALGDIEATDIEAVFAAMRDAGKADGTLHLVYRSLRTFFRWAQKRKLIATSPMEDVDAPRVASKVVPFVADHELRRMLATCRPRSRHAFRARRDDALLRVFATTGCRLGEVAGLTLDAVDLDAGQMLVDGKTGERIVPLDEATVASLRTYITRERVRHELAGSPQLWLGSNGAMTPSGIAQAIASRGEQAGIERRVHPHELRHRAAHTWLKAGVSELDVMQLAGWKSPAMLRRYGAAGRTERAIDAFRAAKLPTL
jgi:site-specific recombinase XerD